MENSAEALKMAAAVMIFVIALSLAIMTFSQARETSDIVLRTADETSYYDYETYTKNENDTNGEYRIVGMETVIPTLYKYSKENYTVRFLDDSNDSSDFTYDSLKGLEKLRVYSTPQLAAKSDTNIDNIKNNLTTLGKNLNNNEDTDYYNKFYKNSDSGDFNINDNNSYNYFDIAAEEARQEPWTGSDLQIKLHLDAILNGGTYIIPSDNTEIRYDNNELNVLRNKSNSKSNSKFIELVSRIKVTKNTDGSTGEVLGTNTTTTKTIITYILIS